MRGEYVSWGEMNEVGWAVRGGSPTPARPGAQTTPQKVPLANCPRWRSLRGPSTRPRHQERPSWCHGIPRGARALSLGCDCRPCAGSLIRALCVLVTCQQSCTSTCPTASAPTASLSALWSEHRQGMGTAIFCIWVFSLHFANPSPPRWNGDQQAIFKGAQKYLSKVNLLLGWLIHKTRVCTSAGNTGKAWKPLI